MRTLTMNTKRNRQMNDAMRHMWKTTWSQMRSNRHHMPHQAVLMCAWNTMGREHTWREEPRRKVLLCASRALLIDLRAC